MLLDTKLSPYLSSHAYQFWRSNTAAFEKVGFYRSGYSGVALQAVEWAIWLSGAQKAVEEFCKAPTLAKQRAVWENKLRKVFVSRWIVRFLLSNPAFLWQALGVPRTQSDMFRRETTAFQYAADTLDPPATQTHLAGGAYHYLVCLAQRYTHESW